MQFQAERPHLFYDQALALLPGPNGAPKPGLMMASIYRTLLREIEADGFPGAEPAHQPDTAAQVLAGLEDAGTGSSVKVVAVIGAGWATWPPPLSSAGRPRNHRLQAGRAPGGHAPAPWPRTSPTATPVLLDSSQHILIRRLHRMPAPDARRGREPRPGLLRLPLQLVFPDGAGLQLPDVPPPWDARRHRPPRPGRRLALLARHWP